jgi:uncharacterized protein (DUF488 family)
MERPPIFTLGYGSRSLDEVIGLLQKHDLQFLIDVRSQPYSRFKPEFSRAALDDRLRHAGIEYVFLGEQLGGRPADDACYTQGKVDYEKCRQQPGYLDGLARLRTAWEKHLRVALFCSEGKPEECHRSKLIGASLIEEGIAVLHIDERGELITQEQVTHRVTGGQGDLFGAPAKMLSSRKRYSSASQDAEGGDG